MQWANTSTAMGQPEAIFPDQNYSIWGGATKADSQSPQGVAFQQDYAQLIPIPQLRPNSSPRDRNTPLTINVSYSKNVMNGNYDDNHLSTGFDIGLIVANRSWMISRRYGEFIMLHQQLPDSLSKPQLPPLMPRGPDQPDMCMLLKSYLEQIASMPGAWNSSLINDFLDDASGILHLQAEVQALAEEKSALQSEVTEVRAMLSACTQTIQQQGKALILFERRLSALDGARSSGHDRRRSWGNYSRTSQERRSLDEESDRSSHASSDFDDLDSHQSNVLDSIPDLSTYSPSFSLNCHADELVSLLTPSFPSNKHRHRVVKYIAAHIRKSLGATSLCLGSFAERTYLPDQPVTMSCFLCRGQEASWFIRVNETLCKLSGDSKQSDSGFKISNVNFVNKMETKLIRCTVNNVAVSLSANQLGGLCLASFVEEVDVIFGNDHLLKRSLLLVKAWWMYESAAEGSRNNLSSYIPEEALTVMVIALFNCQEEMPKSPPAATSIHGKPPASTPLEFLLLFFETYMSIDWSRTCVTIYGLRDLFSATPADFYKSSHIPQALLDKFFHCFKHTPTPTTPIPSARRRQSKGESLLVGDIEATIQETENDSDGLGVLSESILDECLREEKEFEVREMNIAHPLDPLLNLIPHHHAEGKRLRRLRAAMVTTSSKLAYVLQLSSDGKHDEANLALDNIFSHCWARFGSGWRPDCGWQDPSELRSSVNSDAGRTTFDTTRRGSAGRLSSQSDRLSDPQRRSSARRDSFQSLDLSSPTEASRRASFRDSQSSDLPSPTVSRRPSRRESLRESYPSSEGLSDGRRASIESIGSDDSDGLIDCNIDCLSLGAEELWKQVEYCRLLLEVEVTEPALRTLAAEILSDKGPLPVGEIGKLLQEITANSNLSTILKDKFGGLKKFLEKYEQDFFVSNDHPFNPHVYLKGDVSDEQMKLLLSGQPVPTPVVVPSRRSKKAARRKHNMLGGLGGKDKSPIEKANQSRFTRLFQSSSKEDTFSPNNPNAPVFVPRSMPTSNL